jgi:eukaryotic-like serine/threonine-protein kinase
MDAARWQKIKDLFDAAAELAPDERARFFDRAGADAELRREVEKLLASFESAADFMEEPAVREVAGLILADESGGGDGDSEDDRRRSEPAAKDGALLLHYEMLRPLGKGGMGEVYLARDTRLNRQAALKVLPAALTGDESRLRRFKQEAQAASALNHPNILTIYEIGETPDGVHFIAAEFVEGETLREKISGGPMSLKEAIEAAAQVASALSVAHAAGVVHRDIKPENIMIRPDGIVKLLDFGLAKLVGTRNAEREMRNEENEDSQSSNRKNPHSALLIPQLTNPGMVLGTVNYMSPEQAQGAAVDRRTDLWSLGVCLYEMLSGGRLPFSGKTVNHTLVAIMENEPPPLSHGGSRNIPAQIERIVARLLSKQPQNRYQTAGDLLTHLRAAEKRAESDSSRGNQPTVALPRRRRRQTASTVSEMLSGGGSSSSGGGADAAAASIAILPFLTLGFTEEEKYLGLGLADALITQLSQSRRLSVRPTGSVRQFTDAARDAAEIGRTLRVGAILEGNLQKFGERLRVTVQLINTESDATLWADKFVVNFTDFFEVQDQISEQVSRALLLKLSASEQTQINKRRTESNAAYLEYLKGRHFWEKRDLEGFHKAVEHYKKAIDLDPTYALAYVGLSDVYCMLGIWAEYPQDEIFPRARAAAERALDIDENLAEAHASLGRVAGVYDWDWRQSEKSYLRAIELNPSCLNAHSWLAKLYILKHRYDEAIAESRIARRLDPLSPQAEVSLCAAHLYARRYDEAVRRYQKAVRMHPNFVPAVFGLGMALAEIGEFDEAIALQKKAVELSKNHPLIEGFLAATYAYSGARDKALEAIEKFKASGDRALHYTIAAVYARLNDKENAFRYLEDCFAARDHSLTGISIEPEFDNLRDEPLFHEMLRRCGLAEAIETDSKQNPASLS